MKDNRIIQLFTSADFSLALTQGVRLFFSIGTLIIPCASAGIGLIFKENSPYPLLVTGIISALFLICRLIFTALKSRAADSPNTQVATPLVSKHVSTKSSVNLTTLSKGVSARHSQVDQTESTIGGLALA